MKERNLQTISQDGHDLGQILTADDVMKGQQYSHDHTNEVTADFVNDSNAAVVSGFNYSLPSANSLEIEILRAGRIYDTDGIQFELEADTTLTFDAADATNPRLDLVVAVIDDAVETEQDQISFTRLRTQDDFSADPPVGPYPPQNVLEASELHWTATPRIKKGTPAVGPAIPAYGSNEVPLYLVSIGPNVTGLRAENVIDMRAKLPSIKQLNDQLATERNAMVTLDGRVTRLEDIGATPVDLSEITGEVQSLEDILKSILASIGSTENLPEVLYPIPKVALTEHASSQIAGTSQVVSSTSVVDIEQGAQINFGNAQVAITPNGFADQTLNPRFATITSPGAAHVKQDVALTLPSVLAGSSDGVVDLADRGVSFPSARVRSASAARDGQYVEIFGGSGPDGTSALSDWWTYDILGDTLTHRNDIAGLPASSRPCMIPYGNGKVLVICGHDLTDTAEVFEVNPATGSVTVTAISGTVPQGIDFCGDLLTTGKIFVVATKHYGGSGDVTEFWEYDTASKVFTKLTTSGSVPSPNWGTSAGCYYQENRFLMLTYPNGTIGSAKTLLFDRTTLQWVELPIAAPYAELAAFESAGGGMHLANINGRPLLVGGFAGYDQNPDPNAAKVFELKYPALRTDLITPQLATSQPQWHQTTSTIPVMYGVGLCALINSGRATGKGVLVSGHGMASNLGQKIYSTVQSGLIATVLNGVDAITLADGSSYGQFEIPSYTATWAVAAYLLSLKGAYDPTTIKVEASFDDGVNWATITPDVTFPVVHTSTPGKRRIRITLYRSLSKPPILTGISEALDQNGGTQIESRTVVRFDCPNLDAGPHYLYIDATGKVTLETTATPSTPTKAILMRIENDPSLEDGDGGVHVITSFINRRRPVIKYQGENDGVILAIGGHFFNELATPPRYVNAYGKNHSTSAIYKINDPTVAFNSPVDLTGGGIGASPDIYIVELAG